MGAFNRIEQYFFEHVIANVKSAFDNAAEILRSR